MTPAPLSEVPSVILWCAKCGTQQDDEEAHRISQGNDHLPLLRFTRVSVAEVEWLKLMLRTYQRTSYPQAACPWEIAMRNRLNHIANPDGPLFLHGKTKGDSDG